MKIILIDDKREHEIEIGRLLANERIGHSLCTIGDELTVESDHPDAEKIVLDYLDKRPRNRQERRHGRKE